MRSLEELIDTKEPALPLVQEWIDKAVRPVEMLPPSESRGEALLATQVTTRSPMGAIVYETGGLLIDHGWLRVLGSGHPRLSRTLPGWNEGKGDGFYLVADDAIGGFFAINGGALGEQVRTIHYFAPDRLEWEPLGIGYSDFIAWACGGDLVTFYDWIRWPNWEQDTEKLPFDQCFAFYPFLFTAEGKGGTGTREQVSVDESWSLQMELRRQMAAGG